MTATDATAAQREPSKALIFAMAVSAGMAAANMYYNQPMLGIITAEFPDSVFTRAIPPATQLGFAIGIFLLVPLGDLMDRRRLIVTQFCVLGVALASAALAPSAGMLVISSLLIGMCSSAAQQIVPFAAAMALEKNRGRTVGAVMGGLLCGLLFSRTLAGFVASHFGWRAMFWLAVPMMWMTAIVMRAMLPKIAPLSTLKYSAALKSLAEIWRSEPTLRRASMIQAVIFALFSSFWAVLALYLQSPAFGLGADTAGLFGIVGAVGVLAAPIAGRLADRRGPQLVIWLGAALTFAAWAMFGLWTALAGLIIGVIVLDFGVQSAMVSNQHVIYALRPEARNRFNTIFMASIFVGGAIGSSAAVSAWQAWGWSGVTLGASAVGFVLLAVMTLTRPKS